MESCERRSADRPIPPSAIIRRPSSTPEPRNMPPRRLAHRRTGTPSTHDRDVPHPTCRVTINDTATRIETTSMAAAGPTAIDPRPPAAVAAVPPRDLTLSITAIQNRGPTTATMTVTYENPLRIPKRILTTC